MVELIDTKSKNKDLRHNGEPIKLALSTPNHLPCGFTVRDYGGESSKNIVLSLSDQDDIDAVRNIEDQVVECLSAKSKDIFKTSMTKEEIYEIFNSNLTDAGLLRLKITANTRLYDSSSVPINKTIVDGVFTGWEAKCNFIISGVYFMNKRVGLILRAHHIKLFPPPPEGRCLIVNTDSESE